LGATTEPEPRGSGWLDSLSKPLAEVCDTRVLIELEGVVAMYGIHTAALALWGVAGGPGAIVYLSPQFLTCFGVVCPGVFWR